MHNTTNYGMLMNKDKRIPIMMSDEELAALDEWRFANKIGSRSEAIRRLIIRGMASNEARVAKDAEK